jgi:hypothetical protein
MRSHSQSPLFRKGWNTALESVDRCLGRLPKGLSKTKSGKLALEAVQTLVASMAAPPPRYFATNEALATRYGTSERTITNWRKEGCPFEWGQAAVLKWVAYRRYAPPGMERKFKDRLFTLRLRKSLAVIQECFSEQRRLKLLRKLYGMAPDPDDKRLRCPKNGLSDPKFWALKKLTESEGDTVQL